MPWGDIAALKYKEFLREPVVREADETSRILALVVELGVKGVWQPQSEVIFDIQIVDTDAQSYAYWSVSAVLSNQSVICNLERNKPMCAWMKTDVEE